MSYIVCQVATGLIFCVSIFFIIVPVNLVPSRRMALNYASVPPLCVLTLFLSSCLTIGTVWDGIRGYPDSIEPYSILLLLYGLAYGCISIDESGVLALIATKLASKANTPKKLFLVVFGISSVFTILTSNDVVILTLTPIVCAVCAKLEMEPAPFLISMFFAANVWSALLIIGNPTNVIVGTSYQLDFATYTAWLGLPSIVAGFCLMGMLLLYFRSSFLRPSARELNQGSELEEEWRGSSISVAPEPRVRRLSAALGLSMLGLTLMLMFVLSFWRVPLWTIGLSFGGVMLVKDGILDLVELRSRRFPTILSCLKRLPLELIPFMLGMFILVEALKQQGVLRYVADGLTAVLRFSNFNLFATVYFVGTCSVLLCSVLNNQPMSIFVSTVVNLSSLPPNVKRAAMLSVALGSNFGANLSFVGALAGLMFVAILKPHNIEMRASYFSKAGFAVMPLVCFSAFLVLSVEATIEASWNNRTDNSSFPIRFDA